MKKILITGANSYIGVSFEKYMSQWPEQYQVDTVDMVDGSWREKSFAGYDAVFHVAGIAHIKETEENAHLYYDINRDLAVETAKKAKADGVRQFVFLSSMSVYGIEEGAINLQTVPQPRSNYGKSKLQAEEGMKELADGQFAIATLRPPMVYGDGCKGNYQALVKFANKLPFFPAYQNKRSMIHIDKLSQTVKALADEKAEGLFLPQDDQYVCTCDMVASIAAGMGKKMKLLKVLNPAAALARRFTGMGKKAFGDLYYERD